MISLTTPIYLAPGYRSAIRYTLVLQVLVGFLTSSLFLDGGLSARVDAYVMIGFWIGVATVIVRRPEPTPGDLSYVRWGYLWMLWVGAEVMRIRFHFQR